MRNDGPDGVAMRLDAVEKLLLAIGEWILATDIRDQEGADHAIVGLQKAIKQVRELTT